MSPQNLFSLSFLVTLLFVSTLPLLSSSLSTVAISENSNQTLICALVSPSSDNAQQSFVNCTSFPGGIQTPFSLPNISISAVTAGNGFVCFLRYPSPSTALSCWRFSDNFSDLTHKRIYHGRMLEELDAGNSHICGRVNGSNRLECWQWHGFDSSNSQSLSEMAVGEEFVCGLQEFGKIQCLGNNSNIIDKKPTGNYSFVAAGFRHACAISLDGGRLDCWGDALMNYPRYGTFKSLALGDNRGCALRDNQSVVCWGENNFSLPESLRGESFIQIQGKRSIFCGILTRNYSLLCWGNESIIASNSPVFHDVLPGPCRADCPCMLPGSGRLCGGQRAICQPCCRETSTPPPKNVNPIPPTGSSPSHHSEGDKKRVAFLVVGCVGSVALGIVFFFLVYRYCKGRVCRVHDSGRLDEVEQITPPHHEQGEGGPIQRQTSQAQTEARAVLPSLEKRLSQLVSIGSGGNLEEFSLQQLHQATDNFSDDHKIGSGSYGSVYRATLPDGREVAIKRAEASTSSSYAAAAGTKRHHGGNDDKENAFLSELAFLSRLNHKNLVRLFGFCEEANERVLVYEYVTNGSLHDHLHKLAHQSPLNSWAKRLKVALDAARGIEYLHTYAVPPIIHRDIKSSNILLDAQWTAKVSDFGLSLMGPEDEDSYLSLGAAGTVGYMDPEYYRFQQLNTKSDVYSFGVVLLELLSGYKAIHLHEETGLPRNVVDFVVPYIVKDEIHRVLDPKLPPPTPFEIEAVAYVGYIAADCVGCEGRDRPSMSEIVNSLDRALTTCLAPPPLLSRSSTASSN